jgi:hypothetical protein
MQRDGRTLDHGTLETIRLMAVERVREGEAAPIGTHTPPGIVRAGRSYDPDWLAETLVVARPGATLSEIRKVAELARMLSAAEPVVGVAVADSLIVMLFA